MVYHGMEPSHRVIFVLLLVLLWREMEKLYVSFPSVVMGHLSKTTLRCFSDIRVVNRYFNLPLLQSVRFPFLQDGLSLRMICGKLIWMLR
jgi:hypothetical protein